MFLSKRKTYYSLAATCLATVMTLSTAWAQLGDAKDKGVEQLDPPADLVIPPAPFLEPAEAVKSFVLEKGWKIQLASSEPDIHHPIAAQIDEDGRMWVVEMIGYMPDLDGKGENEPNGRISVLEDENGDGHFEKASVFVDKLVLPRAVSVLNDGILFADNKQLYYAPRKGIARTGDPVVVDDTYSLGLNPEHQPNGLLWGLDNRLYNAKANYRYELQNGKWIRQKTRARGQWGITQDAAGRLMYNHNSAWLMVEPMAPDAFMARGQKLIKPGKTKLFGIRPEPGLNRAYRRGKRSPVRSNKGGNWYQVGPTAASGMVWYGSQQFGKEAIGDVFVAEPSAHVIKRLALREKESKGTFSLGDVYKDREFLASTDERFRPVNVLVGPDGSLYVVDMYHGILQHKTYLTSYLRRQYASRNLDKNPGHPGRIWRISKEDTAASGERPAMSKMSSEALVPLLDHADRWWRLTAQRVLVLRGDASVGEALSTLSMKGSPWGRVHALWTLHGLKLLKVDHLLNVLKSENLDKETARQLIRLSSELGGEKLNAEIQTLKGRFGKGVDSWISAYEPREAAPVVKRTKPVIADPEVVKQVERGKAIFGLCSACHGPDGEGLPQLGPPLAESEWVTGSQDRLVAIILNGMLPGKITVKGTVYESAAFMPGLAASLDDQKVADLATFLRNYPDWYVSAGAVKAEDVARVRKEVLAIGSWSEKKLKEHKWKK